MEKQSCWWNGDSNPGLSDEGLSANPEEWTAVLTLHIRVTREAFKTHPGLLPAPDQLNKKLESGAGTGACKCS